jgi:hypothetical protein
MEKLLTFMNTWLGKLYIQNKYVPLDKFMHGLSGFVGGAAMMWLTDITIISIAAVAVVAYLKEQYDARHPDKHTADGLDFLATTIGGAVGVLLVTVL